MHRIKAEHAAKIAEWFATRDGIAIWRSCNLANPGKTWTTPVLQADGSPMTKPSWESASEPYEIITSASEVLVDVPKEVKRFHIAIRLGRQGLSYKLTDASSAKVRREVDKAGPEAWFEFDYSEQAAVIYAPEKSVPLPEYMAQMEESNAQNAQTSAT